MKNYQIISLENNRDLDYDEELERGLQIFLNIITFPFFLRNRSSSRTKIYGGKSPQTKKSFRRSFSRIGKIFL